ncbi:MAG TPA: aldose 1-epimerase family protein, partial [Candidatus Hydrogenedentes bacterium]|nr:aldose 1-epimerase family protein [Candidatus Hydrogenedentota bacterium]
DGNERPARAALIHTGGGLELTVLLDRALDIAAASYQGKAMGWRSTTGDAAPQYFEPEGIRWLRSYFGGLVATCGLINVGAPAPGLRSALTGEGLHGRIGNTPARNVSIVQEWRGDDYVLEVTGTMRETVVFGENLTLTRTVATKLGEKRFWIRDVLTNDGFKPTPFMLLYHCNIGWPAVDKGSELMSPSRVVAPCDSVAHDGKEQWFKMDGPTHGYAEKCYYHDMVPAREGSVTAAIVNDGFDRGAGFGVYVKYRKDELPRFVQWKQMGEQDYVCGLEPATCGVEGKHIDRELSLLHELQAGERREFHLEFGAITEAAEVKKLRAARAKTKTKIVDSYKQFVR